MRSEGRRSPATAGNHTLGGVAETPVEVLEMGLSVVGQPEPARERVRPCISRDLQRPHRRHAGGGECGDQVQLANPLQIEPTRQTLPSRW